MKRSNTASSPLHLSPAPSTILFNLFVVSSDIYIHISRYILKLLFLSWVLQNVCLTFYCRRGSSPFSPPLPVALLPRRVSFLCPQSGRWVLVQSCSTVPLLWHVHSVHSWSILSTRITFSFLLNMFLLELLSISFCLLFCEFATEFIPRLPSTVTVF